MVVLVVKVGDFHTTAAKVSITPVQSCVGISAGYVTDEHRRCYNQPDVVNVVGSASSLDSHSSPTIIGTPSLILWVAVVRIDDCVGTQWFWEVFAALAIHHERRLLVELATWPMDHVGHDNLVESM